MPPRTRLLQKPKGIGARRRAVNLTSPKRGALRVFCCCTETPGAWPPSSASLTRVRSQSSTSAIFRRLQDRRPRWRPTHAIYPRQKPGRGKRRIAPYFQRIQRRWPIIQHIFSRIGVSNERELTCIRAIDFNGLRAPHAGILLLRRSSEDKLHRSVGWNSTG